MKVFPVRIGKKSSNSLSLHWLHCSFRVWLHWLQCSLRLHWFQCSLGLHWLQCFLLHWSQCSFRLHWLQCSFRGPVELSWMEKAWLASVAALPPLPKHSLCFLCLKPTVCMCFVPNIWDVRKITLELWPSAWPSSLQQLLFIWDKLSIVSLHKYCKVRWMKINIKTAMI